MGFLQHLSPHMDMASLVSATILRLCLAAVLGGVIGLERELKRKPAGLRTNMFICFGSAMFTILSVELAGQFTGDHTRIAAQIIPGIGFIGAGSILHSRGGVSGLTTAATLFVVASIGMAVGGGLYLPACFATLVIFLCLEVLGWMEGRLNLKPILHTYETVGPTPEAVVSAISEVLERQHKIMRTVQLGRSKDASRVHFSVEGTDREHRIIANDLRQHASIHHVEVIESTEDRDQ